jgi:hypothetical protein
MRKLAILVLSAFLLSLIVGNPACWSLFTTNPARRESWCPLYRTSLIPVEFADADTRHFSFPSRRHQPVCHVLTKFPLSFMSAWPNTLYSSQEYLLSLPCLSPLSHIDLKVLLASHFVRSKPQTGQEDHKFYFRGRNKQVKYFRNYDQATESSMEM